MHKARFVLFNLHALLTISIPQHQTYSTKHTVSPWEMFLECYTARPGEETGLLWEQERVLSTGPGTEEGAVKWVDGLLITPNLGFQVLPMLSRPNALTVP